MYESIVLYMCEGTVLMDMTTGEERSWEKPPRGESRRNEEEKTKQAQTGTPTGNEER